MSSRDDGARDERAERAQAEEQAWREIVEHYGDLTVVPDDGLDGLPDPDPAPVDPRDEPDVAGVADSGVDPPEPTADPAREVFRFEPYDERFVPPPLPPPPDIPTDRRLAWVGLLAPPVLLLVVVALDYALPGILTGALVVAFLASFGYLVATMTPRDPDDDGARV